MYTINIIYICLLQTILKTIIFVRRNTRMFQRILGPKIPQQSTNFIQELQQITKKNQNFFTVVQKWRNLQISYASKLAELQSDLIDPDRNDNFPATQQLIAFFSVLMENHKILINKLNHDVFLVNFETTKQSISNQKNIIQNQKILHKQLVLKKDSVDKVQNKKTKLKRQLQEEQTLQIFGHDSFQQALDRKMKRFNKMKQICKQKDEYELKVQETIQIYCNVIEKSKNNIKNFNIITQKLTKQKQDVLMKVQLHFSGFAKKLVEDMNEKCKKIGEQMSKQLPPLTVLNKFVSEQEVQVKKKSQEQQGYLDVCFKSINQKTIDGIIQYSKDKEVKKKIKRIIQSSEINPQNTDQLTRQVQLVKKILSSKQANCLAQFKNIIIKNCKFRLNFVFILQLYRLNNKFKITENQVQPILMLIRQLLQTCDELKDAFVLKQIMILLLTYYINIKQEEYQQQQLKIYLINFFKHSPFWKDTELWESILIECIYVQKKATIRMLLITSSTSNRTELIEAQKTSVMNQILYIARNMLLFDFKPQQVKDFMYRFVKLLRQDDKFLKDVHKSIDNAVKEELQSMPSKQMQLLIQKHTQKILNQLNDSISQ